MPKILCTLLVAALMALTFSPSSAFARYGESTAKRLFATEVRQLPLSVQARFTFLAWHREVEARTELACATNPGKLSPPQRELFWGQWQTAGKQEHRLATALVQALQREGRPLQAARLEQLAGAQATCTELAAFTRVTSLAQGYVPPADSSWLATEARADLVLACGLALAAADAQHQGPRALNLQPGTGAYFELCGRALAVMAAPNHPRHLTDYRLATGALCELQSLSPPAPRLSATSAGPSSRWEDAMGLPTASGR